METELMEILETAAIAVSGFLIKRYVFLEPDMEAGKQTGGYIRILKVYRNITEFS